MTSIVRLLLRLPGHGYWRFTDVKGWKQGTENEISYYLCYRVRFYSLVGGFRFLFGVGNMISLETNARDLRNELGKEASRSKRLLADPDVARWHGNLRETIKTPKREYSVRYNE